MGSNLQLNNQIENYINNNSLDLHPVQKEIIKYNEKLGEIKKMQISVSQCHFLHFIIKITNPKNILEIEITEKFVGERGRINCSLRENGGFWRWLGIQFVISEK